MPSTLQESQMEMNSGGNRWKGFLGTRGSKNNTVVSEKMSLGTKAVCCRLGNDQEMVSF